VLQFEEVPIVDEAAKKVSSRLRAPVAAPSLAQTSGAPAAPSTTPAAPSAVIMGDVLVTTPGGVAHVLSQGRNLGTTPGRFHLPVGQHDLVLRTADGVQRSVTVSVIAGADKLVTVPLH
jgi:hypothetical protein